MSSSRITASEQAAGRLLVMGGCCGLTTRVTGGSHLGGGGPSSAPDPLPVCSDTQQERTPRSTIVVMPKFRAEHSAELSDALKGMGVQVGLPPCRLLLRVCLGLLH